MRRNKRESLLAALERLIASLERLRDEYAVTLKCEQDHADAKTLERLNLTPLVPSTPDRDALWEEIFERQEKVIWHVTSHPPVGKPYPPIATHISFGEAQILGLSLSEPLTLRGYPLVIDYEPRSV